MDIFDLPSRGTDGSTRVASLGSCRAHLPFKRLAGTGDLRLCAGDRILTHTASEALQSIEIALGDKPIAGFLLPYVFGANETADGEPIKRTILGGVDVFIVEVSHDRQFSFDGVSLPSVSISTNLVRPYRQALLGWFRDLSHGRSIDGAGARAAIRSLRRHGFECDEHMVALLRGIRFEVQSVVEIREALGAMMARVGGRWAVVGHFEVPGHAGAVIADRRALNAKLREAASYCGATFYDPSELVAKHGAATALDAGGGDIYEYAPAFYPTVGAALVELAWRISPHNEPKPSSGQSSVRARAVPRSTFESRSRLADRLNTVLIDLHRNRLASMGSEASGQFDFYEARIDKQSLISSFERASLELIEAYLPAYEAYAVLRAGLGEMALLLAASGHDAIAFEPNPNRRAAIEAGYERIRSTGGDTVGSLKVVAAWAPETPLPGRVLGIGLNLGVAATKALARDLGRICAFSALLLDSRRLRLASEGDEGEGLVDDLRALGFDRRRDYFLDSLAWFGRSKPVGEDRRPRR